MIIVQIWEGLGNQLFQYSIARVPQSIFNTAFLNFFKQSSAPVDTYFISYVINRCCISTKQKNSCPAYSLCLNCS